MNFKAIAIATILGLSAPALADLTLNTHAVARPNAPLSTFSDGELSVTIDYYNKSYIYYVRDIRTNRNMTLRGGRVGGNNQRRIYTWYINGVRYQVSWRPSEPQVIRLQTFEPGGKEILNRLLYEGNANG